MNVKVFFSFCVVAACVGLATAVDNAIWIHFETPEGENMENSELKVSHHNVELQADPKSITIGDDGANIAPSHKLIVLSRDASVPEEHFSEKSNALLTKNQDSTTPTVIVKEAVDQVSKVKFAHAYRQWENTEKTTMLLEDGDNLYIFGATEKHVLSFDTEEEKFNTSFPREPPTAVGPGSNMLSKAVVAFVADEMAQHHSEVLRLIQPNYNTQSSIIIVGDLLGQNAFEGINKDSKVSLDDIEKKIKNTGYFKIAYVYAILKQKLRILSTKKFIYQMSLEDASKEWKEGLVGTASGLFKLDEE